MYHQQQNKWYLQESLLARFKAIVASAKIECIFEMDNYTPLGVPFILLLMVRIIQ